MKRLSNLCTILMLRAAAWMLEVACALAREAVRHAPRRGQEDPIRKTLLALAYGLRRLAQWVIRLTPPRKR